MYRFTVREMMRKMYVERYSLEEMHMYRCTLRLFMCCQIARRERDVGLRRVEMYRLRCTFQPLVCCRNS